MFTDQKFLCISKLSHACYMHHPSHSAFIVYAVTTIFRFNPFHVITSCTCSVVNNFIVWIMLMKILLILFLFCYSCNGFLFINDYFKLPLTYADDMRR